MSQRSNGICNCGRSVWHHTCAALRRNVETLFSRKRGPIGAESGKATQANPTIFDLIGTDRSLDTWSQREWDDGVQLEHLPDFACLVVRTTFNVYRLIVLDGRTGEIMVRGGDRFPVYTRSRLEGSTIGGNLLKRLGIYIGLRMELRTGDRRTLTSRVQSITLADALI